MTTVKRPIFQRAAGFIGPEDLSEVVMVIIGCGAVGSNLAVIAAKMGFVNFDLWDPDIVEGHNLPNQAFEPEHISISKVEALAAVLQRFNPEIKVTIHQEYYSKETAADAALVGPVVIATDTMKSRREISELMTLNPLADHIFEARLGFDYGEVHIIDNQDLDKINRWQKTFKDDSEIPEGPCNLKICTTLVLSICSFMVHQICNHYSVKRNSGMWRFYPQTVFHLNNQTGSFTVKHFGE
jgi:hypothetical protein